MFRLLRSNYIIENCIKSYSRRTQDKKDNNKVNEYIMLGLRQITGINKGSFYNAFGLDFTKSFACQLVKYKEYFTETQDKMALNKAGLNIYKIKKLNDRQTLRLSLKLLQFLIIGCILQLYQFCMERRF